MKNYIVLFVFLITITTSWLACSPSHNFKKEKVAFTASAIMMKYKAIGDLNDGYFTLKENNFFEFYMQLFDSLKNTAYPGKYIQKGDTLYLNFYNKKAATFLGSKALISAAKKEIIFFDNELGIKRKLFFY